MEVLIVGEIVVWQWVHIAVGWELSAVGTTTHEFPCVLRLTSVHSEADEVHATATLEPELL